MEVTRHNFAELLPKIEAAIKAADFLAVDGEFTGLTSGSAVNTFDTPQECYIKFRESVKEFLLVQFGLSIFRWDAEISAYRNCSFTFYIFPRQEIKSTFDKIFKCQSSSISFLAKNKFDFNKLFYEGISYLDTTEEVNLRERIEEKHNLEGTFISSGINPDPVPVSDNMRAQVDEISREIYRFLRNHEKKTVEFKNLNTFQAKVMYQELQKRFKNEIFIQSTIVDNERVLVVSRGLSEKEKLIKLEEAHTKEWAEVDAAVGFSAIARLISDSEKLITGHNVVLDLLHTMNNFFCPIPEDYSEFKSLASHLFPNIVDTMSIAKGNSMRDLLNIFDLEGMFNVLKSKPFNLPKIENENIEGLVGHSLDGDKFHSAGFDAFITGVCLVSMYDHLKKTNNLSANEAHISCTSNVLKPYLNRLFLYRTAFQGSPYINLGGRDPNPNRNHVFHIVFPKEWKRSDINEFFDTYGGLSTVAFIDDTSAYVSLKQHNMTDIVKKSMNLLNSKCRLTQFRDYKETRGIKLHEIYDEDVSQNLNLKRKLDEGDSSKAATSEPPVKTKVSVGVCTDPIPRKSSGRSHRHKKERKLSHTSSGSFLVDDKKNEASKSDTAPKTFDENNVWE